MILADSRTFWGLLSFVSEYMVGGIDTGVHRALWTLST